MKKLKLKDLNLFDIGNKIQIAGLIMSDENVDYLCYLPGDFSKELCCLDMDLQDWEKFTMQTDQLETEVLTKDKTGKLAKIILRKSNRQIEQGVSWKVFARDSYTCRYCGITGVPMTVDHVICWEDSGPSIEANLVTACRKCNKLRGNMSYVDWLKCDAYVSRSAKLSEEVKKKNLALMQTLGSIPRKSHMVSR